MILVATPTHPSDLAVGQMVDIPSITEEYAVVADSQPTGTGGHTLVVTVGGGLAAVPVEPGELVAVIGYGSNMLETGDCGLL